MVSLQGQFLPGGLDLGRGSDYQDVVGPLSMSLYQLFSAFGSEQNHQITPPRSLCTLEALTERNLLGSGGQMWKLKPDLLCLSQGGTL